MFIKRKFTEEELIVLVKDKSNEAFSALYENYAAALYGAILKVVDDNELAQEIFQNTIVKIWKNFASYDASKGKLFTWMLNIARNNALEAISGKHGKLDSKIQPVDNSLGELNLQAKVAPSVDFVGSKEVIKKLRPDYVLLIDLIYFKGYKEDEISKELSIPLGIVKTRIRTALNQMRDILKAK